MSLILIEKLSVKYGSNTVLREVDLEISSGEIVTIVGPNGSGKTSLLKAIIGAVQPADGEVKLKPKLKIGNATWYNVRIAAFSDRFSDGVIVPNSFMNYNNTKFGTGEKNKINRIVISTPNSKNPSLAHYLSDHSYETNSDKISGGKVTEIMNVLFPIIVIISLVIILLSLLTFIQNAQLLLSNSDYEIKLLGLIGYSFGAISAAVMKNFNILFGVIILSTVPIVIAIKYYISSIFNHELGIDIGIGLSWTTLIVGFCIYTCFYLVQYVIIKSTVKKLVQSS